MTVGTAVVTEANFSPGKRYKMLSEDGTKVLHATDQESGYAFKNVLSYVGDVLENAFGWFKTPLRIPFWGGHFRGTSLTFKDDVTRDGTAEGATSSFTFSGSPGGYRLHSEYHANRMLYMLGPTHPREWVVWDVSVPTTGDWEVVELLWGGGGRVKIKGHEGQHVKWAVSGFVATYNEADATEFILREA